MNEDKHDKKWLTNYAFPCFTIERNSLDKLPHIKDIEEFLEGNYSLEKVRDYFFIAHNLSTIRKARKDFYYFPHLVIPYYIIGIEEEGVVGVVNEPFYQDLSVPLCSVFFKNSKLDQARSRGVFREEDILRDINMGNIIVTHNFEIVDSGTTEEFEKYDYLYKE